MVLTGPVLPLRVITFDRLTFKNKIMVARIVLFLIINFGALAIGSALMGGGSSSDWYQSLNKAPWTPPGWVFGAAWSLIMICLSLFMAYAWGSTGNKRFLITIFIVQWILNVAWNPVFFRFHFVFPGLITIIALTLVVTYIFIKYLPELKLISLLLLPYIMWLIIATSLNGYIWLRN